MNVNDSLVNRVVTYTLSSEEKEENEGIYSTLSLLYFGCNEVVKNDWPRKHQTAFLSALGSTSLQSQLALLSVHGV